MTTVPGPSALRLFIILIISTLLFSCGGNSAQDGSGAGIAFRLKWPVAKSVGLVPSGVDTIRMSISGPGMSTIIKDFIVSEHPNGGSVTDVPVGDSRIITFQGFSGPAIIYQKDLPPVILQKGVTYNCGTVTMEIVSNNISTSTTPAAPSGLSVTAVSSSQIDIVWVDNANNEAGYVIERKVGTDATYTNIATVAANDTIFTDTTASADTTFSYRVQAITSDAANSEVTIATTTVVAPASTYSVSGMVTSGGTALAGATVTRSGNGITTKTVSADGNYSFDGTQDGSYTLTPAKNGYTFDPPSRVVTVDGANLPAMNFVATAVNTIPAAPSGLSANAVSSTLINLAWTDNANNETGYTIERAESSGTFVQIATVAANVTIYNDTTVSDSTSYFYRVLATNGVGDSAVYSNEANAVTLAPTYSISGSITSGGGTALAGVTVTLTGSGSATTTTNSSGIYSFSGAQNGDYTLTPSRTDYTFSPTTLAVTVIGANQSAMNFVATPVPIIPADPSVLVATAVSSNLINLSWKDNSVNESGYRIERSESGGTYAPIATVAANVTTYKDIVPAASTAYFYRVQATSGVGDSGYAEANVTTPVAGTIILPELVPVTGGNFSIGKFEVTQREWSSVMGSNPSLFPGCGLDCPVENVSWDDAQNFILTLNAQSGMSYRLPTEAEWQYAAQSGGNGELYSGGGDVNAVAWYSGNSGGTAHPVGQKQANGLGLFDMSGNVWEWVSDLSGQNHISRGGSWINAANLVTTAFRASSLPGTKNNIAGFRLAK